MNGIRIVGIGSYGGDDQAGWQVLDCLREKHAWPAGTLLCCASPPTLLAHLTGVRQLILIDAVYSGAIPGTRHCLTWPLDRAWPASRLSAHGIGLVETLQLAETLQLLPRTVHIYGIELDSRPQGRAMSPPVRQAVRELADTLHGALTATPRSCPQAGAMEGERPAPSAGRTGA